MTGSLKRNVAFVGVLFLAGCSAGSSTTVVSPGPSEGALPTATEQPSPASPLLPTSLTPAEPSVTPGAAQPTTPAPTDSAGAAFDQPWAVAELTDVSTGEVFRIADLAAAGKVVFLETMAIWCTNCRAQQVAAVEAFQQLDPATVEWVAIDIETAETADALARYRDQNGFPFRYAVADTSLSRSLVDQFGEVVLSPPSVNVIVLGTDGRITHLRGHQDPAQLVSLAADHGS